MTALLLLALLTAGGWGYLHWAAHAVTLGAPVWWFVLGAPVVYFAPGGAGCAVARRLVALAHAAAAGIAHRARRHVAALRERGMAPRPVVAPDGAAPPARSRPFSRA